MSTELKKDIHKILVEDFSQMMGFDKVTGLLSSVTHRGKTITKRFSGMPFIGDNYGEYSPKILIVGSDIGSDECVRNNTKDVNGTPLYYHDFHSKRENCLNCHLLLLNPADQRPRHTALCHIQPRNRTDFR